MKDIQMVRNPYRRPKWRDYDEALHKLIIGTKVGDVPHYSTKVAAAELLLAHIRKSGNIKADKEIFEFVAHNDLDHLTEDQFASAICDACLIAIGLVTEEVKV